MNKSIFNGILLALSITLCACGFNNQPADSKQLRILDQRMKRAALRLEDARTQLLQVQQHIDKASRDAESGGCLDAKRWSDMARLEAEDSATYLHSVMHELTGNR